MIIHWAAIIIGTLVTFRLFIFSISISRSSYFSKNCYLTLCNFFLIFLFIPALVGGLSVMMLTKERHGEHKRFDRKTSNRNKIQVNLVKQWLVSRKLRVQCGSYYASTMQMVSHGIVSRWLVHSSLTLSLICIYGGARDVMVIVIGNGHGNMSSNPGSGWLYFTLH